MRSLSERYDAAVAAIDAANADDPTTVLVRGATSPLALAHGRLAAEWVTHLNPNADEPVLLAARAHHLRRWEVSRASYPAGRDGYLAWKRAQRRRHADDVAVLLSRVGFDETDIARVQALVRRDRLATDPDAQVVEDAACLVFLETQLADVAARLDPELLRSVLRKTAHKLSPAGRAAIALVPLTDAARTTLTEALSD